MMNSQHLVSPQEAAAQAQARRMQPSDPMAHHHSHVASDDVAATQQYFNPVAMHARNVSLDGSASHYSGMQPPPLDVSRTNGSLSHNANPYVSQFTSTSHAMPSQLSYPQHSPSSSHAHIPSAPNPGPMPMYAYSVHHSPPQQHYAHVPGQATHTGIAGMVASAGANPMMGAPSATSSANNFTNTTNFGQQAHFPQFFNPASLQSISPSQTATPPHTAPPSQTLATSTTKLSNTAPPTTAAPSATTTSYKVSHSAVKVKSESKRSKLTNPSSRAPKSSSAEDSQTKERSHHTDSNPDNKSTKKSKKAEEPRKPPVLKSRLKPPKQAPSAWQIFFTEELQKIKAQHPDERLNVAHVAKEAGQRYNALSEEKKREFQMRSLEAKEQWELDMTEWKAKLTPEDIRQENVFRSAQRKAGKSRKGNLKDPNAPKKPLSAYFLFLRAIRADPSLTQEVFGGEEETTKQSVLAAAKWRSLIETEKQPYLDRAEQDKNKYEQLRREYDILHGISSSSSKTASKALKEEDES